MFTLIPLTLNCGYVRAGIRELVPKQKGHKVIDTEKRDREFKELFSDLNPPDDLFVKDTKRNSLEAATKAL